MPVKINTVAYYDATYAEKIAKYKRGPRTPEKEVEQAVGLLTSRERGLDIGYGLGRHSFYMAANGFVVDAIVSLIVSIRTDSYGECKILRRPEESIVSSHVRKVL